MSKPKMVKPGSLPLIAPTMLALFALVTPNAAAQFSSTSKMLGTITSTNQSLWNSRQQLERTIKDGELLRSRRQRIESIKSSRHGQRPCFPIPDNGD